MKLLHIVIIVAVALTIGFSIHLQAERTKQEYFVVACRESFFDTPAIQNDLPPNLAELWQMEGTDAVHQAKIEAWCMSGWRTNYHKISDTNQRWYVYQTSTLGCRRTNMYSLTAEWENSFSKKIENNPNVYAGFTGNGTNAAQLLHSWGVTNFVEAGPEL